MGIEGEDAGLEEGLSWYGLTLSEVVPVQTAILQKSSSSTRKEGVILLSWAMLSLLKPLRKCTCTKFEVKSKDGKVWRCIPKVVWYCCDLFEASRISSTWNGAGSYQYCGRCTVRFEDMVHVKTRQNRLFVATGTRQEVQSLSKIAKMMSDYG